MIICAYCGSGNPDDVYSCEKCGAPRRHAFPEQTKLQVFKGIVLESLWPPEEVVWPVRGYDDSAWNGNQDGTITKKKAQFAFHRVGWGNKTKDPKVDYYRQICTANAIEYGLYWYVYTGLDWKAHAKSFFDLWKVDPGKLPPVMDCETTTLDKYKTRDWIQNLLREFELLSGVRPMIYTSKGWWDARVARAAWAKQYALQVAHWTNASSPLVPLDWASLGPQAWTFWQHAGEGNNKGAEYGFTGGENDLDLQRFNGSVDAFNIKYGTDIKPFEGETPPSPTLPTEIVPIRRVQVTASALNVRSLPSATSKDLGDLRFGDILPIIEERDGWYRVDGWISKSYTKDV